MKTLLLCAVALVAVVMVNGCVYTIASPMWAPIEMDIQAPYLHYWDNDVSPEKMGMSEAQGIVLVAYGDASIDKAMKSAGIKKINHVESKVTNILGIYAKHQTLVFGE